MDNLKFRAWDTKNKQMYKEDNVGDCFKWKKEGQSLNIMQFTGLQDKNEKDIYTGDILRISDNLIYNVESIYGLGFDNYNPIYIEIIGNIYENKELLNG